MATRKSRTKTQPKLPPIVYAEASVRSIGGVSMFESSDLVTSRTVDNFYSDPKLIKSAADRLRKEGFQVLHEGMTTISIAAPAKTYERVFKTKIIAEERATIKEFGRKTTATYLTLRDTPLTGLIETRKSSLSELIEGVALSEPVYYHASPIPPTKSYWHLTVPGDVSAILNAERAHRAGITGKKVSVVMVDSGWYRHPYFVQRGYRSGSVVLGPAATNPDHDEHGHGTGESANIFAVAPDVDFRMVKINFVNAVGAFNTAVGLRPDIISCSWGYSIMNPPLSAALQTLAAAVANAVRQGIMVVFSAGNGHWGFPGQHPDVISAGGVYMQPNGTLQATPYASGFASKIYPGRNVPDVCGLVGLPPKAAYIMLPIEPADTIDTDLAGGTHPNGDETATNDGWAAFSGTSAAAPQLAGICALMKQAYPRISPQTAREILRRTARDVTIGNCSASTGGHPAGTGTDLATGAGLVDGYRATMVARFRGLVRPLIPAMRDQESLVEDHGNGEGVEELLSVLEG